MTTLNDILSHSSDQPYTFEAFVDFLARNHCLETLEFISEVKHYRESYNLSLARFSVSGKDPKEREDSYLFREWQHIKDAYIVPNAPREINIPGWMRDALMEIAPEVSYPPPILLEPVLHYAYEMLAEDAVLPFIRSLADIADTNGAGHLQHRRQAYEPPRIIRPVDETVTLSSRRSTNHSLTHNTDHASPPSQADGKEEPDHSNSRHSFSKSVSVRSD
ncbi:regulator of G-protein signaling domain-containing protein [Aspergillus fumigatus Af293]